MTYKVVSYSLLDTFVFYICVSETSSHHFLDICRCFPWLVCFAILVTMYWYKKAEIINSNLIQMSKETEETMYMSNQIIKREKKSIEYVINY